MFRPRDRVRLIMSIGVPPILRSRWNGCTEGKASPEAV